MSEIIEIGSSTSVQASTEKRIILQSQQQHILASVAESNRIIVESLRNEQEFAKLDFTKDSDNRG